MATTYAEIQAQLCDHAVIEIKGNIAFPAMLQVPFNHVRFVGTGRVFGAAADTFHVSGQDVRMEGFEIWNEHGRGVRLDGASKFRARDMQINTLHDGIVPERGAGLWLSGLHFNGFTPHNNRALCFGQWDTAFLTDLLIEEHGCGMRFGWGGKTSNIHGNGLTIDRARVGIQVEANGGSIENLLFGTIWTAGMGGNAGFCPVLVDASSGPINTVRIVGLYATDYQHKQILTNGTVGGGGFSVGWERHL
jgi:hypothetical protein